MTQGPRGTLRPINFRLSAALVAAWGAYQVIAGLYFILLRPSFLPEDLRASSTTLEAIRGVAPNMEGWLQLVFTVVGGQMAAVGVLVVAGAICIARGRRPGRVEVGAYVAAGSLSVGLMAVVNFNLGSHFRWLLLAPTVLWLAAMVVLARETLGGGRQCTGDPTMRQRP